MVKLPDGATIFRFGNDPAGSELATRAMCDVPVELLRWLWPGRIPLGKLSLIVGEPGFGKTLLACQIAAIVSRGGLWPDGGRAEPADVLVASAEDDPADTLKPRLMAAGGDPARIRFLDGIAAPARHHPEPWTLAEISALDAHLAENPSCRLVILDPISAFFPIALDSHENAKVRATLAPLAALAAKRGVAIVAITHLRKSEGLALHRAIGSIAFVAAARSVWLVVADPEDEARRLFLSVKSNLSGPAGGLAFRVHEVPVECGEATVGAPAIAFDAGPVTLTADQALAPHDHRIDAPERDEAAAFLRVELANGPRCVSNIRAAARDAGLAWRTVERGKVRLRVQSAKSGAAGGWRWSLPGTGGPNGAAEFDL